MRNRLRLGRLPLHQVRPHPPQPTVRLCVFGDIMVMQGDRVPVLSPELVRLLDEADVIAGCCEATVGRERSLPDAKYSFLFNMPLEYLQGIIQQTNSAPSKWHLSIANNHAGDIGAKGLPATLEHLRRLGVNAMGARLPDSSPVHVVERGGMRLGIAAWTRWLNLDVFTNTPFGVWRSEQLSAIPWAQLRSELKLDCLIGCAHWEYEWQHYPRKETQDCARQLHQAGFDLVLGSHPHVLQPFEWFEQMLCVYSLGNFCSGLGISWPARMCSVLTLEIGTQGALRGKVVSYRLHPFVQVNSPEAIRLVPLHQAPAELRARVEERLCRIFEVEESVLRASPGLSGADERSAASAMQGNVHVDTSG